jgi:hypothetical protein
MKGSCDHTLNPGGVNVMSLTVGDNVSVAITWLWDGVSVWPACDGPIMSLHAVNGGAVPYVVRTPRAGKPGGRTYTLQPGGDVTLSGSTLANRGIESLSQVLDLTITA